jgi:hypothetical protein
MNLDEEKPIIGDEDNINLEESNWVDGQAGWQDYRNCKRMYTRWLAKSSLNDMWMVEIGQKISSSE